MVGDFVDKFSEFSGKIRGCRLLFNDAILVVHNLPQPTTAARPTREPISERLNMPKRKSKIVRYTLIAVGLVASAAFAQVPIEAILSPDNVQENDFFGSRTAINGPYALIVSEGADIGAANAGAAYVFRRLAPGSWTQDGVLTASDPQAGARFGWSIAIENETAVVGRLGGSGPITGRKGAVYIFNRNANGAWTQSQKLTASDGIASDWFGYDVSISNDVIIVGAPQIPNVNVRSGAAYIFRRQLDGHWAEEAKLVASNGAPFNYFGYSVGISGDVAVVGAPQHALESSPDPNNPIPIGSSYVFRRTAGVWSEEVRIQPEFSFDPNNVNTTRNGWSVGVSGDTVITGSLGQPRIPYARTYDFNGTSWDDGNLLLGGDEEDSFASIVQIDGAIACLNTTDLEAALYRRSPANEWHRLSNITTGDPNEPIIGIAYGDGFAVAGLATADEGRGRAIIYDYRPCAADVDDNGTVDITDLSILLANYGLSNRRLEDGDITSDGVVGLEDLSALLGQFGRTCK